MIITFIDEFQSSVLAGATAGAQSMAVLIELVSDKPPAVVFLDFQGVEAATGSFLRECVLGFRNYCRRTQADIYPVIANATPVVEEEFRDILLRAGDAFVSCRVTKRGKVSDAKVIGRLDQRQVETLRAVVRNGEATASELADASKDKIGVTAWNNRLVALASKGILAEHKSGRLKTYSPVIKELRYGS
jgi:hypothetical protein